MATATPSLPVANSQQVINGLLGGQEVNANPNTLQGNYWVGSDGNVYGKFAGVTGTGGSDTVNLGSSNNSALLSDLNSYGATQINNPVAQAAASNPNQGTIDQIQGQLGQLDTQQGIGLNNLQNSYQSSMNQLNQQHDLAQNQFNTSQHQNTQNYVNNRNNIITNTNAQMNALQRLLGLNGAGNSSAAYDLVPYAASQYGSQGLNQAQQTYGQNGANLQNAWDQTQLNYNNDQSNLGQQLYAGQNNLKSGIAQTRANLLSELGQLQGDTSKYTGPINDLLSQITQLSNQYANPVLNTPTLSFTPASLADYSLGPQTAATNANNPGQSDVNPTFLGMLQGQQRDPYGNLIKA